MMSAVLAVTPNPSMAADSPPTFTQTDLVSDLSGTAKLTDPFLANPWGIATGLNSGLWVSDNHSGKATVYDATGQPIPSGSPLAVTIPGPGGMGTSAPTGVATNGTAGFALSPGGPPAIELFATEDGTIAGWNDSVDPTHALIVVDNSASGAIYKGLAIGFNGSGAFLFATNFSAGTIDVFDSDFHQVQMPGAFTDPNLPSVFAPFGISSINSHLYVTYARQDAEKEDDVPGPGDGFVDIFDTQGNLLQRFASRGQLNAPWGMAWAPLEGFGGFNNALLVGNFGDGTINAFDFDSGEFIGKVSDSGGNPITIPGLWALQFGLGLRNASSTLYFTAGIDEEEHGLFGTLTVNPNSVPPPGEPTMHDPSLTVSTVVSDLVQPTSMAFLGPDDFFLLEKASGKVQRVVNGSVRTVLTLPVNSASERGLLGIALQPDFTQTHGVYLYWTQSQSGVVSDDITDVPLLGNRVDRYVWDPNQQTLTFDKNLIRLRSFQADPGQPPRGNHDGGKIAFGPDGKLYFQIGDQGRRGQMQNLAGGPFGPGQTDDQFGGPAPDDPHFTGVIFRLNPDGSTPADNPFASVTAAQVAQLEQQAGVTLTSSQLDQVVANIHKVFSYGHRNSFGLAFDPIAGSLWESENGDDSFDEMNRVTAGSNGGWIQLMGPADRIAEFKAIEASFTPLQGNLPVNGPPPFGLIDLANFIPAMQQLRWPPTLIADTTSEALQQLFVLPGSHYEDPEFSWKWAVAPAAIGFAGDGLGAAHANNLFVGESRTFLAGGYLFEFKFDPTRQHFTFDDPDLADKVDDNDYKFDEGESEDLIAGENFGIVTNIVTGPDGNLYVTSLSNGAVYKITSQSPDRFEFSIPGHPESHLTLVQGNPPTLLFDLMGFGPSGPNGYHRTGQTIVPTLSGAGRILSVEVVGHQIVVTTSTGKFVSRDGFIYQKAG